MFADENGWQFWKVRKQNQCHGFSHMCRFVDNVQSRRYADTFGNLIKGSSSTESAPDISPLPSTHDDEGDMLFGRRPSCLLLMRLATG
jgi:hypothetical protein